MVFKGSLNSSSLIGLRRRMATDSDHKVFLILDNLRVHHSKPVKEWLAKHVELIEVFHLPS